jgi:hypothetical protein
MQPAMPSHRFNFRGRVLLILSLIAVIVGFVVGAHALLVRATRARGAEAAQGTKTRARVEAELVTLTPTGFEPREIARPPGPFLLSVDNYSGQDSVTLHLTVESRGRLREVAVPGRQRDWSEVLTLPPGRYTLAEANHPGWVCHITIR